MDRPRAGITSDKWAGGHHHFGGGVPPSLYFFVRLREYRSVDLRKGYPYACIGEGLSHMNAYDWLALSRSGISPSEMIRMMDEEDQVNLGSIIKKQRVYIEALETENQRLGAQLVDTTNISKPVQRRIIAMWKARKFDPDTENMGMVWLRIARQFHLPIKTVKAVVKGRERPC